jgi:prepilin-type N-terminal cleavage/methylation domain-containing protein
MWVTRTRLPYEWPGRQMRLRQIKRSATTYALSQSTKAMNLRRDTNSGFTLVELLIAAAITVVIILMLGGMFLSLMNTSLRANQRVDAFRDARAALQIIQRDMANLVQLPATSPTPTPTPPTSPTPVPLRSAAYFALDNIWQDPNDPVYSANNGSLNRQIFALIARSSPTLSPTPTPSSSATPAPTPAPTGDLCAVGYY